MDVVEHSLNGPAENQGFHVNASAYPGQGAGVPGSGPGSQQMRGLPIHSGTSLPPPPQQQSHPQPPPTPTSTPPASDMGKPTQIQPNVNFVQTAQRGQANAPYFTTRMSPPTNARMPGRPPVNVMNINTMSIPPYPANGHVMPLSLPPHHHFYIGPPGTVSQIQNFTQPRPHSQPAGQNYFQHQIYQNVMPINNTQYISTTPNLYVTTPGNMGQYTPNVSIQRTGYTNANQGQMNMQPASVGPQPSINMSHPQPIVSQQPTQQAPAQRSKTKQRDKAIPIINPETGKNVLEEVDNNGAINNVTPPQSNDSSARETPQPGSSSLESDAQASSEQQQVRAEFAAMVAAAATNDVKQSASPPSMPEAVNGPENAETEIIQSVPNSESVKSSKLSSSHLDDYTSISHSSDVGKESTGHNVGPPIHSHVQPMLTPVVSALTVTGEIQPNWSNTREPFPALKTTSSPTGSISSPVKNVRKQPRINSESEKITLQEKLPQPTQPVPQPQAQIVQPVPPSPAVTVNPAVMPVDHTPAPSAVNVAAPVTTPSPAPATTPVPITTSVQKKEKNAPSKTSSANASKEDVPVTNQHPHPPPKERREKQRSVPKEIPPPVQPQAPTQSVPVNVQLESASHKPSFSESIKPSIQTPTVTAPPAPVVQSTVSVPASVTAPMFVPEEKISSAVQQQQQQQQQTNGETLVEQPDGKASQRQGQKKKSRMKVINTKAVDMEGTDMDAFTETIQDEKEKLVPTAPTTINNPAPVLSKKTPLVEKISKDELEEKMVAAKNEENTKVSALSKTDEDNSPAPIIEKSQPPSQSSITLKHKYKDDQWSPINPEGKKKYEREFLLGLQTEPQSMKKPENLPNLEVVLIDHSHKRAGSQQFYPTIRGGNDFSPSFVRSQGLSRSQMSNRKSQQGSKSGKGGGKTSSAITHISISLKDEIKLRETENAWKPARFNSAKDVGEEQRKTQDLYKKVRSILNKLTPQKFDTLVSQVKALPIDTSGRLQGVIDLVFDKAIDEPGFAKAYAHMCKLVANMEVKEDKTNDGKGGGSVVFRKLLLARCQHEFESNKIAELNSEKRLQDIKACPDPEKKKELQLNYEEEERRIRRKSVGNIRFIGELYKLQMLTSGIMHRCIQHLLSKHEEESLECLCKLLTTIGKDLESVTNSNQHKDHLPSLDNYFDKMSDLAQKRENSKISSRVRFMLQDVIELRQHKWVPRRDDNNPKTIDQIQRDADRESMEMSLALSAPRKQDIRGGDNDRKGRNRGGMNQDDNKDGWQSVSSNKSFRPSHSYQYEPSRIQSFKQQPEMMAVSLGSASQFNQWGRGVNSKSADKSDNRSIAVNNMYGPLSKDRDGDKKHSNVARSGKITPSPSLEKERMMAGIKEAMDTDRQSHRVQQSSQPPSRDRTPTPARVNPTSVPSTPAVTLTPLTQEEIERKAKLIAEEYLCNNNNLEEAKQSIEDLDRNVDDVLFEVLMFAINKNAQARASIGKLFADLIDMKFFTHQFVLSLYVKLCEQIVADEWIIDIPLIWTYFAEFVAPLVRADKFSFVDLSVISKPVAGEKKGFFLPLIQFLCQECGENWVRNKWVSSRVQLTDFIANPNDPNVQKVVVFLSRKGDSPMPILPMEEVQKKLTSFLQTDKINIDQIFEWINVNVGKNVKDPQFIRALMTAICESSTNSNKKLIENSLRRYEKLLRRFIDQVDEIESECLCAIQAFITKLEHPSGLLLSIFTFLWDNGIISNDAFLKWRDNDNLEEGKGVAVKSLTSFFTALNESEMSDEAS